MSIAPEKTEVLVFPDNGKVPEEQGNVEYEGETLKLSESKKIPGIVLDSNLTLKNHIQGKSKAGFSILRCLDSFIHGQRGCSQSFTRLWFYLYLNTVIVSSLNECCNGFGKVQISAMIKVTGCLNSTSTESFEILTNSPPIA